MNWTGGNLSRHSRGNTGKGLVQRQKGHFAKARSNLQDGNTICNEPIALHLSQSPLGRCTDRPRALDGPGYDRGSGTCPSTFHNEASFEEPIATAGLSNLPNHGTSAQACSPALPKKRAFLSTSATIHDRRDSDNYLHDGPLLEAQKRRLLAGKDWLGLTAAKPVYLRFEEGEEKAGLGKRKRVPGKQRSRLQSLSNQYLPRDDGFASESMLRENEFQIKIGSQAFTSIKGTSVIPGAYTTGMDPGDIEEDSASAVSRTEGKALPDPSRETGTMCEQPFHDEEYFGTFPGPNQDTTFNVKTSRAQDSLHVYAEESEGKNSFPFMQDYHESAAISSVSYPSEPVIHNCSTEQEDVVESPLSCPIRDLDRIEPGVSKSKSRSSSLHDNRRHVLHSNLPCATIDGAGQGCGDQRAVYEDDTQWKHLLGLIPNGPEDYESDQQDKDDNDCQRQNMSYSTWPERVQPILFRNVSATTSDPLSELSNAHFDCSTSFMGEPLPDVRTNDSILLVHDRVQPKGDVESLLNARTQSNLNKLRPGDGMDDVWKRFIFGGSLQESSVTNNSGAENMAAASTSLPAVLRQQSMTVGYDTTTGDYSDCKSEHSLDSMGSMTFESLSATAGDTYILSLNWRSRMHRDG